MNLLFDIAKLQKRKTSSQVEILNDLKDELPIIYRVFHEAFDMAMSELSKKPAHFHARNSAAVRMNENLQGLLTEHYGPRIVKIEAHRVCYIDWERKYKIYFKKLDNNFLPQYKPTLASEKKLNQIELTDEDSNPIIYIGYQVDDLWSSLTGIHLICVDKSKDNKEPIWRKPLVLSELSIVDNKPAVKKADNYEELIVRPKIKIKKKVK